MTTKSPGPIDLAGREIGIYGTGENDGFLDYIEGRHPRPDSRYPCIRKTCPLCNPTQPTPTKGDPCA